MSYLDDIFSLDDRVAVVIGGGGVLGGAFSTALARAGARVAVLDVNASAAEARAAAIRESGGEALGLGADVTAVGDLESGRRLVEDRWGRVDVLLNAPGVNSGTPLFEITEDEWQRIVDVNLKGVFLACRVFGHAMIERGAGGSIINVSSVSSGPPLSKVLTYGISKAGVNNLTQFLAREWAPHRVRVNALAPGFFPAEQNRRLLTEERTAAIIAHTPMARFGEPEELTGAVLWLASERASGFVTGAVVRVDGGFTAMTI